VAKGTQATTFANRFYRERASVMDLLRSETLLAGISERSPQCAAGGEDFGRAWFGPIRFGPRARATASKAGGQALQAGEQSGGRQTAMPAVCRWRTRMGEWRDQGAGSEANCSCKRCLSVILDTYPSFRASHHVKRSQNERARVRGFWRDDVLSMPREAIPCSHAILGWGFSVTVKDRPAEAPVESEHLLFPGSVVCHFDMKRRVPILLTTGVTSVLGFGK
jgi:hypothetical protein